MQADVEGKSILITGATQGIGRAIALECAASGAEQIVISGLDKHDGGEVAAVIQPFGCTTHVIVQDLSQPGSADLLFNKALKAMGRVDALVNAAGLTNRASALGASRDDWALLFQINAQEPFFLIQNFLRARIEANLPGQVVNILSMNAHLGSADLTIYAATKAALALITRNIAHHHRFDRIRLNGINVGWADTPGERHMQANILGQGEDWIKDVEAAQPFGRLVKPDDVARLAVYLLSDASAPMTGSIIDQEQWVSGGP
ncbi:MAG: oxidoreductase [Rhizobiaceae bacterium]